jgi:hypothetical protein
MSDRYDDDVAVSFNGNYLVWKSLKHQPPGASACGNQRHGSEWNDIIFDDRNGAFYSLSEFESQPRTFAFIPRNRLSRFLGSLFQNSRGTH